ncbi:MAG: DUF4105 domain-containing protein [Flavobacteriales bacterium]
MNKLTHGFLALLFACTSIATKAEQTPILSNEAEISLLTCSPGEELYSLFGHSAMRVRDPQLGIDVVFNYGTFSFDEDFYFNFTMGRLNYRLSAYPMANFMVEYQVDKRGVIEQTLNLDSVQKQGVLNFLNWNLQPENRYYLYDFFYDNCSSVLRDVLDTALNHKVQWADLTENNHPSYRNIIDRYLIYHPWGDFGIDLGLGLPCDKQPNHLEYMFLPDKLLEAYDHATLDGKPLVSQKRELLQAHGLKASWSIFNPVPLFWLLFGIIAVVSSIGIRKNKLFIGVDALILFVYGIVGALIFFLWFISDHNATHGNLNILWAWPTHLFALFMLWHKAFRGWYFRLFGIVALITLLAFPFLPQDLHVATIPLILVVMVRSFTHWKLS